MTKTNELVERYVNDEFKAQVVELHSNPYLGIYGVVLGFAIIANTQKIVSSMSEFILKIPFLLSLALALMFFGSVISALFAILIQSARVYNKDIHKFQLDQEVENLAAEERAKMISEHVENDPLIKLDERISEAVRLRVIYRIIEINKKYRKLNRQKTFAQRVTAICLFTIALVVFGVFSQPVMLTR